MMNEMYSGSLEALAKEALERKLAAGIVVRVEQGGITRFERAWGSALCDGVRRSPMTPNVKFDAASLTKLFTATAILRLAAQGKLSLDAALRDIATTASMAVGRPRIGEAFAAITVRQLLTHSSGLHYWHPFYAGAMRDAAAAGLAAQASPASAAPAEAAPSAPGDFGDILESVLERFPRKNEVIYSDLNFMLLGKILEGVSGFPLKPAMRDFVCGPLKLADTGYKPSAGPFAATEFGNRIEKKMVADLGLSFDGWRPDGRPFLGEPDDGNCHYYFGGAAGHAGVFTTARDLCALGRLYLDPASHSGYISPRLAADAIADHGGGRGLGFQLGELYPEGGCGHTGFTGTYLYLNPARNLAVAVLANRLHVESPQNINEFRKAMAAAALAAL
jgi:CubicO group peptidase (beta-lactamase class C family)